MKRRRDRNVLHIFGDAHLGTEVSEQRELAHRKDERLVMFIRRERGFDRSFDERRLDSAILFEERRAPGGLRGARSGRSAAH